MSTVDLAAAGASRRDRLSRQIRPIIPMHIVLRSFVMSPWLTEQLVQERQREACSQARGARLRRAVRAQRRARRAARKATVALERAQPILVG